MNKPVDSPVASVPFPLLADPAGYVACALNLAVSEEDRRYWLQLFRGHFPKLLQEAAQQDHRADLPQRLEAAARRFNAYLDAIERKPDRFGRLDILSICYAREEALAEAGIVDAYQRVKSWENEAALALLPRLLNELDALPQAELPQRIIEGVFAGNIFDLGATETIELLKNRPVDFHATRRKLAPRPWRVDDLDRWLTRLKGPPHRCAVLFVDNAGCDVLLGMAPLARQLLQRGTEVILTANTHPSLNDVTHEELLQLLSRIREFDPVLRQALQDGRLEAIPSGNNAPLIDLSRVSAELAGAVRRRGVDLVILEGMGRAVESNFDAAFTCDVMKIAMIKDAGVARFMGGRVYDLVLRFEAVG